MALATKCQTPGTQYKTIITPQRVNTQVFLPFSLNIGEAEAEQLEANIHNALELVLAPYFVEKVN